jgi:hypothetical protein
MHNIIDSSPTKLVYVFETVPFLFGLPHGFDDFAVVELIEDSVAGEENKVIVRSQFE